MSILTWRDVATPEFNSSVFAQRNANDAMNQAFASAQGALQGFKDAKADVADRNILNRMLAYQNPDDLKAALADGSLIGSNGNTAHAAILAGIPKQVGDMIQNSLTQAQARNTNATAGNTEQQTAQTATTFAHGQADWQAGQNLNPIVSDLVNRYHGATDVAPAMAELGKNPIFMKMPPDLQNQYRNQLVTGMGASTVAGNALFGTQVAGTDAENAQATKNEIARITAPGNFASVDQQLGEAYKIANPIVKQNVMAELNRQHPGLVPQPADILNRNRNTLGGVGGPELNTERAVFLPGGGANVVPDKDYKDTSIGEAMSTGTKMLNAQKASGSKFNSSAQTEYMMTNGTMDDAAKDLYKTDASFRGNAQSYTDVMLTPQNREKMAQWVFNRAISQPDVVNHTGENNLGNVWKGLTPEDLATIKASGNDWNTARALIVAHENRTSIEAVANKMNQQTSTRQSTQSELDKVAANNPLVASYSPFVDAGIGDDKDKAADYLIGNIANFKGGIHQIISDNIQHIIDRAKEKGTPVNAAQAALILSKSTVADSFGSGAMTSLQNIFHPSNQRRSENGTHVDMSTVDEMLPQVADRGLEKQAQAYSGTKAKIAIGQQLSDAQFNKNMTEFQDADTAYARNPTPENLKIRANALSNLMGASIGQAQNDANTLNIVAPPAPQQNSNGKAGAAINQAAKAEVGAVRSVGGTHQQYLEGADGQQAWVDLDKINLWKSRHN